MNPTVRVDFDLCLTLAAERRRPRQGADVLRRWAIRWCRRHGFVTTDPPPIIFLGEDGDDFLMLRKRLHWRMFVKPGVLP